MQLCPPAVDLLSLKVSSCGLRQCRGYWEPSPSLSAIVIRANSSKAADTRKLSPPEYKKIKKLMVANRGT